MIDKGILKVVKREDKRKVKENKIPIVMGNKEEVDKKPEEEVVEDETPVTDYTSMLKKDLKEELDRRGIQYDENALKEDLIALLQADDQKKA